MVKFWHSHAPKNQNFMQNDLTLKRQLLEFCPFLKNSPLKYVGILTFQKDSFDIFFPSHNCTINRFKIDLLHERFFFQFLSQYSSPYRQHPMRQNIKNKKVGLEKYLHITVLLSLVMLECVNDSISTGWFSSSTIIRNAFGASRKKSGLAQTRQNHLLAFALIRTIRIIEVWKSTVFLPRT